MSWTNDLVLEFLDLYRAEQHLWDPKHPQHRNRGEVNNAWFRIKSSLTTNCTIIDLKRKKESLMTSFRMHFNKKKKNPDSYHTTWFAYPVMESFLGEKYECDSTNQMEQEFFNNASVVFTHTTAPISDNTGQNMGTVDRKPAKSLSSNNKSKNSVMYVKREDDSMANYRSSGEKRDKDEYELYGQLLAKKLRKLDEHQRDVAMHDIDNIMFRAKMKSSNTQSRSYSSSPSPISRKLKSPIFLVEQVHQQYEDENTPYQEHMQPQPPS